MSGCLALFLPSLTAGGAEQVMVTLAGELVAAGESADLVLASSEGPLRRRVPETVRLVDLRAGRTLTSLPALAGYLRRERPQALLAAMDHANLVALAARTLARVPTRVVPSVHSLPSRNLGRSPRMRDRLIRRLLGRVYRATPCLVAVSTAVAQELETLLGIPPERIRVIPNPVVTRDLRSLSEAPSPHPWLNPGEPPLVLGVGRLSPVKDFATLIRAFGRVRESRPARLVVLGEGPERGELEALVRYLALQRHVALPGYTDNPYPWMRRASVLALSSRWEGLGNVLIEAMACGTPVVSTRCPGGPAEILGNGRFGELVPPGDPDALADAILRTLASPPDPDLLRARAAAFSAPAAASRYLQLLKTGN